MFNDREHPPESGGDRAAGIVVGHDDAGVADPAARHGRGEVLRRGEWVAARSRSRRAGQVDIKIDEDGASDVAGVVRGLARTPVDVPPHIRNDEVRLVQMRREPARIDKGSR